jgi:hypothetical protein
MSPDSTITTPSHRRYWVAAIFALAIIGFILRAVQYGGYFAEDAYINFRFVEHIVDGHGVVWNIGQEPVEGFTSPLHILLMVIAVKLGLNLSTATLLLSILSIVVLLGVYIVFLRQEVGALPPVAAVVLLVYLIDGRLAVHVTSGLDTILHAGMLAASFLIAVRLLQNPTVTQGVILAFVNFLCLLTRPDAAIFLAGQTAVLGGWALIARLKHSEEALLKSVVISLGALVVMGLLYLVWKISYYGYLLPNPFYIKSNELFALYGWNSFIRFWRALLLRLGLIVVPALPFLDYGRIATWWRMPLNKVQFLLLIVPPLLLISYYITVVQEVNYLNRFEYPAYYFFYLAVALLLSLGRPIERFVSKYLSRRSPWAATIVVTVGVVILTLFFYRFTRVYNPWFEIMETRYYRPIGTALAGTDLEQNATIVIDSAGIVPYVSKFAHIDPVGLTDNVLSGREPINATAREAYIWGNNPDVYIGKELPATQGAVSCADDPLILSEYVQTFLLRPITSGPYFRIIRELSEVERCELLHMRMRELRDRWQFVGEVPHPVPTMPLHTTFAYVRTGSPHRVELVEALEPLIGRKPADFVFSGDS